MMSRQTARMPARRFVPVFLALTGLLTVLPPTAASADGATVIVLDASNSMWGQINGKSKIELARESLASLLEKQTSVQPGLIVYGSRRKSSCTDINVVLKPGASGAQAVLQKAGKILPQGRSPISAALEQAAELAGNNGDIVLITDGRESCDADPCATAQNLRKKYSGLKINVVSFSSNTDAQVRCVAESTGGQFALTDDAAALQALLTASSATTTSEAAAENVPADTPGVLQLTTGAEGADNLQANFIIYDAKGDHVASFTAKNKVSQTVPPGSYQVSALWGQLKTSADLDVKPGQTVSHHFDLGPLGKLALKAVDQQQKPVGANYAIYTPEGDYIASHILRDIMTETLPVGAYRVEASLGNQTQEATLKVTQDAVNTHTFEFAGDDETSKNP